MTAAAMKCRRCGEARGAPTCGRCAADARAMIATAALAGPIAGTHAASQPNSLGRLTTALHLLADNEREFGVETVLGAVRAIQKANS